MDSADDAENRSESNAATMEEMRKKRLAYFNANPKESVNEWEIENPLCTVQKASDGDSEVSPSHDMTITKSHDIQTFKLDLQDEKANHPQLQRNQTAAVTSPSVDILLNNSSSADFNFKSYHKNESPKPSQGEPQIRKGRLDFLNKDPQPLRSKREKLVQKSKESDISQLQLRESIDSEGLSIFSSHPDLGDLGLSTHRPESESSARMIQGELFIPTSQGSAKTTKQLFSEKAQEEMRSALGDAKMEELMLKVNADIGQLHQQTRSPRRRQRTEDIKIARQERNGNSLSRSSSVDSFSPSASTDKAIPNYRNRAESQSPHRKSGAKASTVFQSNEREVPTLVRNYDQITVPKNTKNTFSSEEIYRQAYGGFQDTTSYPEKITMYRRSSSNIDYAPQFDNRPFPNSSRGRKSSIDSAMNASTSPSHFPNYSCINTIPVSPMTSTHFDPQVPNNGVPVSPLNSFRSQAGAVPVFRPPGYPHQSLPFYPEPRSNNPLPYNPFGPQSSSCSPPNMSAMNPYYYPSSPFSSHFGSPRFPENIPFHLPPPPLPPHQAPPKQGQPQMLFDQGTGRNNFSLHGYPGYGGEVPQDVPITPVMKIPHPPTNPPAISRYEENTSKARHGLEGRQSSAHSEQPSVKENEKHFNSFNLQRYFSSIDLSPKETDQTMVTSAPQSSRSADEEFLRSSHENMSSFTNASEFTSATKAGGITNRLTDLGVNLDHLKHLWVVDSKGEADAKGDALTKLIRRCPECNTANKTYMMFCIECGESLIGVEPSLPRGRKKQHGTNNTAKVVHHNSQSNQEAHRAKTIEQERKLLPQSGDSDLEDGNYLPKDSPESGRGISLSSSPVRYRRDQEEPTEPKDSGRASIGDPKDGGSDVALDEEESLNTHEEFDDNEVEYVYEDVEADIYEQISDPILRDFIISYRNRQELNLDPILNSCTIQDTNKNERITGNYLSKSGSDPAENKEFFEHNRHQQIDENVVVEVDQSARDSSDCLTKKNLPTSNSLHQSYSESSQNQSKVDPSISKSKKSRRKKKNKSDAIDIEIFGYEETRQSRNFNRCENIVPTLNLVRSSEEESSDDDDDESDSDDENGNFIYESNSHAQNVEIAASNPPQALQNEKSKYKVNSSIQSHSLQEVNKPSKSSFKASSSLSKQPCSVNQGRGSHQSPQVIPKGSNPVPANYQRHWARSSIAWSSYKSRELNTRSSIPVSQSTVNGSRPSSARLPQHRGNISEENNYNSSNGRPVRQRPASAEYHRRKPASSFGQQARPSSASNNINQSVGVTKSFSNSVSSHASHVHTSDGVQVSSNNSAKASSLSQPSLSSVNSLSESEVVNSQQSLKETESPRLLCSELHRLPDEEEDEPSDKMHAIAKTAYDRFHELTPRIQEGGLSLWQCLPDEIWLYILSFLGQADLARLMTISKGFHRLANDATLWRYITVRQRYSVTDEALSSIASHRPISLAMVKCQGGNLSLEALDMFFRDTQERLQELNICGCSQGSLVGSVVLETASKYCHNLTHIDVSFCNIRDNSFMAMVESVNKLESLCINGFQTMSDSAFLTLLRKHGKSLHTLELYACFSLTAAVLRKLGDYCTKLRRLCLGGCNKLTDSTMITLSTCLSRVEELDLRGCKNLRNECIRKIVRNCPRISTLVLANCQQISDAALVEMGTYLKDTLRVVDVCGCNLVGDQGVISLAKNCNQLSSLDISSTKSTTNSLNHLAGSGCSRWLKTIKLSFLTGLSEASMLNLIRQCPRLKLIHIFGCSSLKNLARLKAANPKVCIEGDVENPRLSFQ